MLEITIICSQFTEMYIDLQYIYIVTLSLKISHAQYLHVIDIMTELHVHMYMYGCKEKVHFVHIFTK